MNYPLPKDPEYQAKLVIVDRDYTFTKGLVMAAECYNVPIAAFLDYHETLDYARARRERHGKLTPTFLIEPILRNSLTPVNPEPNGAELASNLHTLGVRPEQIIFQSNSTINELVQGKIFTPTMISTYQGTFMEKLRDGAKIFKLIESMGRTH